MSNKLAVKNINFTLDNSFTKKISPHMSRKKQNSKTIFFTYVFI